MIKNNIELLKQRIQSDLNFGIDYPICSTVDSLYCDGSINSSQYRLIFIQLTDASDLIYNVNYLYRFLRGISKIHFLDEILNLYLPKDSVKTKKSNA